MPALSMFFFTMTSFIPRSSLASHLAERKRPLSHDVFFGAFVNQTQNAPQRAGSSVRSIRIQVSLGNCTTFCLESGNASDRKRIQLTFAPFLIDDTQHICNYKARMNSQRQDISVSTIFSYHLYQSHLYELTDTSSGICHFSSDHPSTQGQNGQECFGASICIQE